MARDQTRNGRWKMQGADFYSNHREFLTPRATYGEEWVNPKAGSCLGPKEIQTARDIWEDIPFNLEFIRNAHNLQS